MCSTKKAAKKIVLSVNDNNGFEAWRLLSKEYGRKDALGTLGMNQQLLAFDFGDSITTVNDKIEDFKAKIKRIEESPLGELPGDLTLKALVLTKKPEPLKQHLQLNAEQFLTYKESLPAAKTYLRLIKGAVATPALHKKADKDAMDVDNAKLVVFVFGI